MDAIDYEPPASVINRLVHGMGSDDFEEEVDFEDSDSDLAGELGEWGGYFYYDSDDEYEDFSDEESQRFKPHDLRNPKTFPSYVQCAPFELYDGRDWKNEPLPPPRHWCYLGEIVEHDNSLIRNVLTVKGKDGKETHLSSNFDMEAQFSVKVGSTIAVLYAEKKYFSLGLYGLRLDHAKFVKIFPCNLETLLRINDDIDRNELNSSSKKCNGCDKAGETFQRCSRCASCYYCGKDCQTADWKRAHKRECKIFQAVAELKSSRNWGRKKPRQWVAFGEHEEEIFEDSEEEDFNEDDDDDDEIEYDHIIQPDWKDVKPAIARELQGSFTISSGELIWGQLASVLCGLETTIKHDFPSTEDQALPGGTIFRQDYTHRVPAKIGIWKIIKVNGYGDPKMPMDSWLAYHSSCDPLDLLLLARSVHWSTRSSIPRVRWVNRYDWGYHCADPDRAARIFAHIDPEAGWAEAYQRREEEDDYDYDRRRKKNPEQERWERLDKHSSRNTFLIDAAHGAEVLKLVARPSALDAHIKDKKSSSLLLQSDADEDAEAFGCNLAFISNSDWEFARLIFSEEDSAKFPGNKELIGFWYDGDNRYNDAEMDMGITLGTPIFEII
ncbi:SET domain protein, sequence [Favolaschia claudopus]|uniref:SET domain protein, sequence n=1 Tax=Favolaschia claudopus TaxID=2862362 RepID=A0AAW0BQH9_9AGAR